MTRIDFSSSDWNVIHKVLFIDYANYNFLYLNCPMLENKRAYLLFKYISDRDAFDEALNCLISKGVSFRKSET